jgi:hypothetical protein
MHMTLNGNTKSTGKYELEIHKNEQKLGKVTAMGVTLERASRREVKLDCGNVRGT